jgi:hypothetical protein
LDAALRGGEQRRGWADGVHMKHHHRRVVQDIEQALLGWDQHFPEVAHISNVARWHSDIKFRVWREKVLLHRVGMVSDDWEKLVTEADAFEYCSMRIANELAPHKEEAA